MGSPWKQKTTAAGDGGGDYDLIPADTYPAVLVAMVDIGTVEVNKFQSSETEWVRKVVLVWELTGTKERKVISCDFRLSGHPKARLRKFLEGWRGRAYGDAEEMGLDKLPGQKCLLKVTHRKSKAGDKTFHEVESASAARIGGQPVAVPDASRKPLLWSAEGDDPAGLPEWLPYLYGRSLADWAESSEECSGTSHQSQPASAPAESFGADPPVSGRVEEIPF